MSSLQQYSLLGVIEYLDKGIKNQLMKSGNCIEEKI